MRSSGSWLRWLSIAALLAAAALTLLELAAYSRARANLPAQMAIAGVPVGNLSPAQAGQRLLEVYGSPIEIHYGNQVMYLSPSEFGFALDLESMLAGADLERTQDPFWIGFWNYLWGRPGQAYSVPLKAEYSASQLNAAVADIAARYDRPGTPPQPVPGSPTFSPGTPGTILNQAVAVDQISSALLRGSGRQVELPLSANTVSRPTPDTLQVLLKQILQVDGFDGLMDLYMMDLQTGADMHIVSAAGQELTHKPDIAFSAASTAKIEILVAAYRYLGSQMDAQTKTWLQQMITLSENPPADSLMEEIDLARGPLVVTDLLNKLGLENTFLAGYFRDGAPLLRQFQTPSNQRADHNTDLDPYNQTTPTDMGALLADIYECAQNDGGALRLTFPLAITQQDCNEILDLLAQDNIAVLIQAGVPDGTRVAHKHGWITDAQGNINYISDAAVVYTPGGNYVLTIYLWKDGGLIWDRDSKLVADLSRAVFNYFNPPAPSQ